jgi:hypothetical protein
VYYCVLLCIIEYYWVLLVIKMAKTVKCIVFLSKI